MHTLSTSAILERHPHLHPPLQDFEVFLTLDHTQCVLILLVCIILFAVTPSVRGDRGPTNPLPLALRQWFMCAVRELTVCCVCLPTYSLSVTHGIAEHAKIRSDVLVVPLQ